MLAHLLVGDQTPGSSGKHSWQLLANWKRLAHLSGFVVPMLNCRLCVRCCLWILAAWAPCGKMARPKSFIALQMAFSNWGEMVVCFLRGMGSSSSVSWSSSFFFFFFFFAELPCGLESWRNASSGADSASSAAAVAASWAACLPICRISSTMCSSHLVENRSAFSPASMQEMMSFFFKSKATGPSDSFAISKSRISHLQLQWSSGLQCDWSLKMTLVHFSVDPLSQQMS